MTRGISVTRGIIFWVCLTFAIVFLVFFVLPSTEFGRAVLTPDLFGFVWSILITMVGSLAQCAL